MMGKIGIIIGIVVGALALITVLTISIYFIIKKKSKTNSIKVTRDFVEFSGDNTEIFKVVDVGSKIRNNTVAIVPPTHNALIIRNGVIVNVCSEGEYPLTEKGVTIHSLKVIYISKTAKVTINWGTKLYQRIEYRDPKVGKPVSVGAFGIMDVRVSDPKKFYLDLVANFGQVFSLENLQERIRTLVVDDTIKAIDKVINDKKLSYLEFISAKYDVQTQVGNYLSDKFTDEFGFEVSNFIIENLNITKEQEEELKQLYAEDSSFDREKILLERKQTIEELERKAERSRKEAIRDDKDIDDFLYERQRDREREQNEYERKMRHEDEDRAWAREDKARDVEERLQNKHMDTVKDIEICRSEAEKAKAQSVKNNVGHHCSMCGASYEAGAKYCPKCGTVLPREDISTKCSDCGTEIPWGVTFCPNCGRKFGK